MPAVRAARRCAAQLGALDPPPPPGECRSPCVLESAPKDRLGILVVRRNQKETFDFKASSVEAGGSLFSVGVLPASLDPALWAVWGVPWLRISRRVPGGDLLVCVPFGRAARGP